MASFVEPKKRFCSLVLSSLICLSIFPLSAIPGRAAIAAQPALTFVKGDAASGLKEYRLKSNGLKILLQEKHNSPAVTVMVTYKVGSRNEAVGYTGSTHFLEHMMFKGTPKHDPQKGTGLDDILKPMGGVNNASTSYDRTDYYEVVPSNGLAACLDLEADRMRHALLRNSDRTSEMTVVRNELERGENTAINKLDQLVFSTAFREHPYHHPTIGWRSDVEGVPTERLRQFYNDFYYPNNATLFVIGDFKTPATLKLIEEYFAKVPASPKPFPKVYTTEPAQEGERRFVVHRGDELAKVMLGYHIPNAVSKDTFPLEVIASLLGDQKQQSSRLYKQLVDAGLASQVGAINLSMRDPGLFTIVASASTGTKAETIEKTIESELARLAKEPVPEKELERAKKSVWKKMKLEADDPAEFAQQLSDAEAVADWTWLINVEPKVKAVTAAQVQEAAKKYFTEDNKTVGYYLPKAGSENSKEKNAASIQDSVKGEASIKDKDAIKDSNAEKAKEGNNGEEHMDTKEKDSGVVQYVSAEPSETESPRYISSQIPPGAGAIRIASKGTAAGADRVDNANSESADAKKGMIASKTKKKVLANGLTVYVLPVRGNGIVAVSAKIKGCGENGAALDKTALPGLVGEMLNKGSVKFSKEQLADALENMGSSFDPQVEPFWAAIESEVVTEDLDELCSVFSDSLRTPLFQSDELEKLKKQKESELKDAKVETAELAANKLLGVLYKPSCVYFQRPYEEQIDELKNVTVDDLKAFHKNHYVADNVTLSIVGDLSVEQGFALAEKYFGSWEKGAPADMSTKNCACSGNFPVKEIVSQLPDKSNVDIFMGYPADVSISSKDFCAAQLANAALGHDTLSSRLAEVREKYGYSYDIHSMFSENAESWSPWVIQLSVNPENTNKSMALVRKIVSEYVEKGITPSELAMEKQRVAGEYIVYRMRTPKQLADALTKYGALGLGPEFMDRYPSMLSAVTLKEANEAIKKYMQPDKLVTSLAGSVPQKTKNK